MTVDSLTRHQFRVAQLIAQAATSKQIAATLGMTDGNVERHVCQIAKAWNLDRCRNIRVQIALKFKTDMQRSA
jgi:DNA-binding NarL/FixJ family response regulator